MRPKIKGEYFDSAFLFNALMAWIISATLLLLIASVLLNELGCTEKSMGYVSSLISFIAALVAGITAGRKRKAGTLYTAMLTASVLVTALLTLGFMIEGVELVPSSVMSVISFSFTGCMVGTVFFSSTSSKKRYKPKV